MDGRVDIERSEVSSILLGSIPNHGHATAVIDVGRGLVASGHRVRMLTTQRYRDRVRNAGLEFIALPAEADVDLDDPNTRFPERERQRGLAAARFDLLNLLLEPVPHQLAAVEAAVAAAPTDAVLVEPLFAGAGLFLDQPAEGRPLLGVLGVIPCPLPGRGIGPYGMGLRYRPGALGALRGRVLDAVGERVLAPAEARLREIEAEVGRRLPGATLFEWPAHADVLAQLTVSGFEYPRPDVSNLRFVGPVSATQPSSTPLPEWWGDLDDRPIVHVTQGTLANKDLSQLILPTLDALADRDVQIVASLGGRPVDDLPGPHPTNARIASYLPYDQLLPRTDLLVSNGGYTTVQLALSHGIPVVVAGSTEDKAEVAARVRWSGVGIGLRTDTPSPERVRRAVDTVLSDPKYRHRARVMAAEMADAPGVAAIESLITGARST